ncbi:MAG TPA: acyl-CoA dehydrogenase family protein [Jatrophihabitans sp.]|nr:acyl-CoA dehydrogenase family protein [Jatrophihabitans sp.]
MTVDIRELTRQAAEAAAEHAAETDAAATFPVDALNELRRGGLLGLLVPAELGGLGGGLDDLVTTTMELGRADLSVALIFAMHCQQVATVERYACPQLREAVLPAIAAGKVYLGSVTTAPGTGGHLLSSDSAAEQAEDGLLLDRQAPIVTGGCHADAFLVTMGTPGATSPAQVDLVYATRDQLSIEVLGGWSPLGMRATESVPMRLRGTVPAEQVIGTAGGFRNIAAAWFAPLAHIGWSAAWLGTAVGAYSRLLAHVRAPAQRSQFDPGSELLLCRLAEIRTELETVHALLRHTVATLRTTSDPTAPPMQLLINALKMTASQACYRAVDQMVELAGLRHGYLTCSPLRLERALRDLRSASLNYANDRLMLSNGALTLLDVGVHLA